MEVHIYSSLWQHHYNFDLLHIFYFYLFQMSVAVVYGHGIL
jgi:hypothetical protein